MSVEYALNIREGTIYDGSGRSPIKGDVAGSRQATAAIGQLGSARIKAEVEARGLAVAPGFINMLGWADRSLLADGRSQTDIRQVVRGPAWKKTLASAGHSPA